jgi:hypothetical protein
MTTSLPTIGVIRDWTDAYVSLKNHAEATRGAIESDLHVGDRQRWPRTTGDDVLCIAALLDPCVHSLLEHGRFGTASVAHHWRACLRDLERWAVPHPQAEYLDNRRFWDDLLTIMVHLSSAFERLPTQAEWDQLLASFHAPLRNAVPKDVPFGPFPSVADYGELFTAQRNHLVALRGSDFRSPEPGMPGVDQVIPRATYQDVFLLRDFWSRMLDDAKEVMGHEGVKKLWQAESEKLQKTWKDARSKTDVYPYNNGFWRALSRVAVQVNVADEAPSTMERVLDSTKEGARTAYSGAKAAASGASDFLLGVPGAVGRALNQVAGGLLGGLFGGAAPYVIGGGLLGGYLLLRGRRSN